MSFKEKLKSFTKSQIEFLKRDQKAVSANEELWEHILVSGGTLRNAIVRGKTWRGKAFGKLSNESHVPKTKSPIWRAKYWRQKWWH